MMKISVFAKRSWIPYYFCCLYLIRQERFVSGTIAAALENGFLAGILERLKQIRENIVEEKEK
jgi:hypothetical protein